MKAKTCFSSQRCCSTVAPGSSQVTVNLLQTEQCALTREGWASHVSLLALHTCSCVSSSGQEQVLCISCHLQAVNAGWFQVAKGLIHSELSVWTLQNLTGICLPGGRNWLSASLLQTHQGSRNAFSWPAEWTLLPFPHRPLRKSCL